MTTSGVTELIGEWITDSDDIETVEEYGNVTLSFTSSGSLIYTIHAGDKEQVILLTYLVKDGVIITDQPSAPKEEETPFRITPEGQLILYFGGKEGRFIRKKET